MLHQRREWFFVSSMDSQQHSVVAKASHWRTCPASSPVSSKLVGAGDSAQGRRSGSSKWILASALAGVGGRRLLAGDAVPTRLDDDPLDAQSECVPCQLCLFSDALDEPTPSLRDRTEAVRPRP